MADNVVWVPDEAVTNCKACHVLFSVFVRKHHCRSCGQIFCSDCSNFGVRTPDKKIVRVCLSCHQKLSPNTDPSNRSSVSGTPFLASNLPQSSFSSYSAAAGSPGTNPNLSLINTSSSPRGPSATFTSSTQARSASPSTFASTSGALQTSYSQASIPTLSHNPAKVRDSAFNISLENALPTISAIFDKDSARAKARATVTESDSRRRSTFNFFQKSAERESTKEAVVPQTRDENNFLRNTFVVLVQQLFGGFLRDTDAFQLFTEVQRKVEQCEFNDILLSPSSWQILRSLILSVEAFLLEQQRLKKIILVQSHVRGWLVRKKFRNIDKEKRSFMMQRNKVCWELTRTEAVYVKDLENIVQDYYIPLKNQSEIPQSDITTIFCNIEELLDVHRNILQQEYAFMRKWPFLDDIGAHFLNTFSLLQCYGKYASNFQSAMDTINRLSQSKSTSFMSSLFRGENVLDKEKEEGINLQVLLSVPLNRIIKYALQLEILLNMTSPTDPDYANLMSAWSVMQQTCNFIRTSLETAGQIARINNVQRRLITTREEDKIQLCDGSNRYYIREGSLLAAGKEFQQENFLKAFKSMSLGKQNPALQKQVFLFSDLLLITRPTKNAEQFELEHAIMLKDCVVNEIDDVPGSQKYSIEIKTPRMSYELVAKALEEKTSWLKDLRANIKLNKQKAVFGVPLVELLEKEKRTEEGVPLILQKCTDWILKYALQTEGIFRIAGKRSSIEKLKNIIDEEGEKFVLPEDSGKTHCITDVWKSFFRDLPEPPITFGLYDVLLDIQKNKTLAEEEKLHQVKAQLMQLPDANQKLMTYIISFLCRLSEQSSMNKMTPKNLSILVSPLLLRPAHETIENTMNNCVHIQGLVEFMITHGNLLFSLGDGGGAAKAEATPPPAAVAATPESLEKRAEPSERKRDTSGWTIGGIRAQANHNKDEKEKSEASEAGAK